MSRWSLILFLLSPAALAEEPPSTAAPLANEMQNHMSMATSARDAVIHADLAGARVWGRGLAESERPAALPRRLRPLYAQMQVAALTLAQAPDLQTAATAVGKLGKSCAECHSFTGGGPRDLTLKVPPQSHNESANDMALHQWGASWLWIGLVADDAEAWKRGAKALEEAPFRDSSEPATEVNQTAMEHLAHLVPGLAEPTDRDDMALRFGQTLMACSTCHGAVTELGEKAPR